MQILFLIGRIIYGGFFLKQGIVGHFKNLNGFAAYAASKGVPYPKLAVAGSGLLITLGGLGVMLGIMPQLSLGLIIAFLIPVTFTMHNFWKIEDPMQKGTQKVMFEKNLALAGAALMMLSLSLPWAYSLFK